MPGTALSRALTRALAAAGLALGLFALPALAAEPAPIVFGQSAVLSGPAAALGQQMQAGIRAAFEEANREGGIGGRRLQLVSRDDRYEPEVAIENTHELIDKVKVFGLIGAVGTPTSKAAEPIATAAGVPYVGAFSGADLLRHPYRQNIINFRASYDQETEMAVERLSRDLGVTRVAILYQDDSFGRAGLEGTKAALARRNLALVSEGTFPRNSIAVKTALISIRAGDPQAIIMIGTYEPIGQFVRWVRKLEMNATLVTISFVGSNALADDLGAAGKDVVITQVVPFPSDDSLPLVARYRSALTAINQSAQPDFVSLEGYAAGRMTVEALRQAGADPTPKSFLEVFKRTAPIDLGGLVLTFGENDNQGSDQVFLTAIGADGKVAPISHIPQREAP